VENLELDPASRKVHRGKREIKLSPKEFELLFLLMRHAGETVSRQELLRESWGLELESDSNLVDVYVNYLRKKIDHRDEEKLIYTVRGSGYRIGRPAPLQGGGRQVKTDPDTSAREYGEYSPAPMEFPEIAAVQHVPLRSLIHSLIHDLAQPLTSVRCFLEVAGMQEGAASVQTGDLHTIEQQADRAIALTKGISALVREPQAPAAPWTSLDALLNDIFNDFIVLLHSGLLTLDRQWDISIKVTSNPMLRHLIVLFLSKLVGRNTKPLLLTIAAEAKEDFCLLELKWRANDGSQAGVQDARSIFFKDIAHLEALANSIGAELSLAGGQPELLLKVPAAAQSMNGRQDLPN
jgi:DNA-binding winged helix-turn-helix (wHTH) protein